MKVLIGADVDPGLVYTDLSTSAHLQETCQGNSLLRQQEQGLLAGASFCGRQEKTDGNSSPNKRPPATCAENFSKLPRQNCVAVQNCCCAWSRKVIFGPEYAEYDFIFRLAAQSSTAAWATGLQLSMATRLVCFSLLCIILFQRKRDDFWTFC